jgi:hypothetical protein
VLIRWEGTRQPLVWIVPAPAITPLEARLELARRYVHVFGPTNAVSFAKWAGIGTAQAGAAFEALGSELTSVTTPIGERSILAADESAVHEPAGPPAPARLLPSGDAFYLLWGDDRDLLVPDPSRRDQLWTSRVWPGAVLVAGEIAGTWRRANERMSIQPWRRLSATEREAVDAEARALPLPGARGPMRITWDG